MFSTDSSKAVTAASLDPLDRTAVGYLILPLVIFLGGWFNWWAAIPLLLCTIHALRFLAGKGLVATGRPMITASQLSVAIGVGCAWTLLGGADHLAFANSDWHVRDAVLHDLVASPWPVGYGLLDGKESLLRAPLAFYLPPALVGKGLGLAAAHVAMGLWTAAGATLFLLQVLSLCSARPGTILAIVAVVVSFSGLDMIGNLLNDGPRFRADWNITTHLEWWAGKFQYSSMTTQLFWVPNHALGGWLTIGLLYRNRGSDVLNALLPIIVVAVALWSPLTVIGLVPFVLWRVVDDSLRERSARLFNPRIWGSAAIVGVVVAAYLALDPGQIPKGFGVDRANGSPVMDLLQQAQFYLLEVGFIGATILGIRRSAEITIALVVLALLPVVRFGPANDIVMRASIPSLAVLTIAASLALVEHATGANVRRYRSLLIGLLVLGAMTPIAEISRAILLPAWPINMSATLIGVNCGGFAPHYVARLGNEMIGRLLARTHRLAIGPQGSGACDNPALELMWNFSFSPPTDLHLRPALVKPGIH